MTLSGQLTFLGTGASMGTPVVGCTCSVCQSTNPHDKRLRPSALLQIDHRTFLIDAGPDFRQQALREDIHAIDGLILSHAHQDHTGGMDDLRPIYFRRSSPLPVLLSVHTAADIERRFDYIFKSNPYQPTPHPKLVLMVIEGNEGHVEFEGIGIDYMTYEQGGMQVNGFRFGPLAYISDIRHYPLSIFDKLKGVEALVISALRFTSSPLHFTVDEAVEFADKIGAKEVWLTHISHELGHDKTNAYLPPHVRMAYDGLKIEFGSKDGTIKK